MPRLALLLTAVAAAAGFAAAPPPLELDHITIVVPPGAPGAALRLSGVGFRLLATEPAGRLPGTGGRTLGFQNAYVELLWVTNRDSAAAADPELAARLRWDDAGTSRFGVALRQHAPGDSLPFATRERGALRHAKTADHEPMVSIVSAESAWPAIAPPGTAEAEHPNGTRRITQVTWVHRRRGGNAEAIDYLQQHEIVRGGLAGGDSYLEVELDDGQTGKRIDLRPGLPLVFRM